MTSIKSSFQELMALVAHDLQARGEASLVELLGKLRGLRSVFEADRDSRWKR